MFVRFCGCFIFLIFVNRYIRWDIPCLRNVKETLDSLPSTPISIIDRVTHFLWFLRCFFLNLWEIDLLFLFLVLEPYSWFGKSILSQTSAGLWKRTLTQLSV